MDDFVCDIAELRGVLDLPPEALRILVEQGALPLEELVMTDLLPSATVEHIAPPGPSAEFNRVAFELEFSYSGEVEGITSPRWDHSRWDQLGHQDQSDSDSDSSEDLLVEEDAQRPGFYGGQMTLFRPAGEFCTTTTERTYRAPTHYFTIGEVILNIIDFEVASRPHTLWFGGVDVHHRFFEFLDGIDGRFGIMWGS